MIENLNQVEMTSSFFSPASPTSQSTTTESTTNLYYTSPKRSSKIKIILMICSVLLLLGSAFATTYLVKQRQEVRKKATSEEEQCLAQGHTWCGSGCCPDGWCYGPGCWTGGDCDSRDEEACRDHQGSGGGGGGGGGCGAEGQPCCDNDGTPGGPPFAHGCNSGLHCLDGGQQADSNEQGTCQAQPSGEGGCEKCVGRCNKDGCWIENQGYSGDCKTGCNMWPACFYCRGRSQSGCSSGWAYHQTSGSISYDSQYWCSTIQCDSNATGNAYVVVYIGDNGQYCVEGTGCNPDSLDWDCGNLSCSSLSRNPGGAVKPGDILTFTCSHSGSGFHHYNFRYRSSLHDDWQYGSPGSGYQNNTTGTVQYQVSPGTGGVTYTFQCQACRSDNTCTSWGNAQ